MALKNCNIVFPNNPLGQFVCGETIIGKFNISLQRKKKIRGFVATIIGESYCGWKAKDMIDSKKQTKEFKGYVIHCEHHYDLTSHMTERENGFLSLAPRTYSLNFTHKLADDLPPSLEGLYGSTSYKIIVTCFGDGKNKVFSTPFTVLSNFDLNASQEYKLPIVKEISENFKAFGFYNGCIIIRIHIPKSGFIIGENIPIECQIFNESYNKIYKVKFSLWRENSYFVTSPYGDHKMEKTKIAKTYVGTNEDLNHVLAALTVPLTTPSIKYSDLLIKSEYYIKASFKLNKISFKSLKAKIPITIGTMPVAEIQNDFEFSAGTEQSVSQRSSFRLSAPPTYNEVIMEPSGSSCRNKRYSYLLDEN